MVAEVRFDERKGRRGRALQVISLAAEFEDLTAGSAAILAKGWPS